MSICVSLSNSATVSFRDFSTTAAVSFSAFRIFWAEAVELYREMMKYQGFPVCVYKNIGLCEVNLENYAEAKKAFEYVVKKDKKCQVYNYKGSLINNTFYDKIRLERNRLQGFIDKAWDCHTANRINLI